MKHQPYLTPQQARNARAEARRRPTNVADLVEVHDDMTAVFGSNPEAMDDPHARAVYLLDATRIRAANRQEKP